MPIQNSKYIKFAFAQNGERNEIPIDSSSEGAVSWEQGYTADYEQNPEAGGKYILRRDFNGALYDMSEAVKNLQTNGIRLWDSDVASSGGYPAGAKVVVFLNFGTNELMLTPKEFIHNGAKLFMSNTITLVSLKDNNTDNPIADNNIFKSWWVDDGNDLFYIKISLSSAKGGFYPVPAGYLDVGSNTPETVYKFDDYPRIAYVKTNNALPDYIIDNGDDTFSIKDLRGGFLRVWSNGSDTVDIGRQFGDWQTDAIRNISGGFANLMNQSADIGQPTSTTGAISVPQEDNVFINDQEVSIGGGCYGPLKGYRSLLSNTGDFTEFNASRIVPTSDVKTGENRPYNFNIRMYLKV